MLGIGRRGPLGREVEEAGGGGEEREPALRDLPDLDERDAWAILGSIDGVGPVSFERLVGRFGSAIGVLAVARRRDGVRRMIGATASEDGPPTLDREAALLAVDAARAPDRWLEPIRRAEVDVLTLLDDAYPTRLRRIGLPPPVLFVRGDVTALERPRAVAIVGTRR